MGLKFRKLALGVIGGLAAVTTPMAMARAVSANRSFLTATLCRISDGNVNDAPPPPR